MEKIVKLGIIGAAGAYLVLKRGESDAPPGTTESLRQRIARISTTPWQRAAGQIGTTPDPKYVPRDAFSQSGDWPQEVIDEVLARLKAKWDELSTEAKKEACNELKEAFPEDPGVQSLDCGATTFSQILTIATAAASFAVCGPACTGIAILTVTLFGDDVGAWLQEAWNSIAHREGIGGPFERTYWHSVCYAAREGSDEALLKILSNPELTNGRTTLEWCADEGYPIGIKR